MERRWLCARPPLVGGMNRRATGPGISCSVADHRILAAVVFLVAADSSASHNSGVSDSTSFTAFVATGASDSSLALLALSTRDHKWLPVAQLWHHQFPVISLAHMQRCRRPHPPPPSPPATSPHASSQQHLLISGATDGGIAIWDVSSSVAPTHSSSISSDSAAVGLQVPTLLQVTTLLQVPTLPQVPTLLMPPHMATNSRGLPSRPVASIMPVTVQFDIASWPHSVGHLIISCMLSSLQAMIPLMVISAAHAAGVNAISAKWLADGRAAVVSGGDDQSLLLSLLHIPCDQSSGPQPQPHPSSSSVSSTSVSSCDCTDCPSSRPTPSVRVVNAHSSALRAVWTDGRVIFTCGLDQKLRCWSISATPCTASQDGCCARSSSSTCCCRSNPTVSAMGSIGADSLARHCSIQGWDVAESGSMALQVLEPSCLAVEAAPPSTAATGGGQYLIAVGGRGLQLLTWEVASPE